MKMMNRVQLVSAATTTTLWEDMTPWMPTTGILGVRGVLLLAELLNTFEVKVGIHDVPPITAPQADMYRSRACGRIAIPRGPAATPPSSMVEIAVSRAVVRCEVGTDVVFIASHIRGEHAQVVREVPRARPSA